jgi:hypothetical protein
MGPQSTIGSMAMDAALLELIIFIRNPPATLCDANLGQFV